MRRITAVALLIFAVALSANAQASIDPGMSKDQVIAKLGKPSSEHSTGTTTYLYYKNGQEKQMGMSDMVAIENGKVVDAVFRSSARKYTGKSSSPAPVSKEDAIVKGGGKPRPAPMKVPAKAAAPAPVAKTATKADAKSATKADPKAATKADPKAATKADPKAATKSDPKTATPTPTKKP